MNGHFKDIEMERHYNRFGLLDNGDQAAFRLNKSYLGITKGIQANAKRILKEVHDRKFELPAPVSIYRSEIPYVQMGLLEGGKKNG